MSTTTTDWARRGVTVLSIPPADGPYAGQAGFAEIQVLADGFNVLHSGSWQCQFLFRSPAADKRLAAGDVIVEVSQEQVGNTGDLQKRVDQLKKEGRKSALLLVANAQGELRFVALALQ